jgi:hypothetical protein
MLSLWNKMEIKVDFFCKLPLQITWTQTLNYLLLSSPLQASLLRRLLHDLLEPQMLSWLLHLQPLTHDQSLPSLFPLPPPPPPPSPQSLAFLLL